MSDTDQNPVPSRSSRRFRRLIVFAATVCVLAVFAALMVWSTRPRWRTFVSKPTTSSPAFALVIHVPVGWECPNGPSNTYVPSESFVDVEIYRKPPTAFQRCWERLLHLDT